MAHGASARNYVDTFENVLHSPGFADPVTGYAAYIDVGGHVSSLNPHE